MPSRRRFIQATAATTATIAGLASGAARAQSMQLYLAIYRPGPAWRPGRPTSEQPLREHGRYMLQLHRDGRLKFAGGFGDDSGGAAAFEAVDDDGARRVVDADPAVVGGVMTCTVQRWNLVDWQAALERAEAAGAEKRR